MPITHLDDLFWKSVKNHTDMKQIIVDHSVIGHTFVDLKCKPYNCRPYILDHTVVNHKYVDHIVMGHTADISWIFLYFADFDNKVVTTTCVL